MSSIIEFLNLLGPQYNGGVGLQSKGYVFSLVENYEYMLQKLIDENNAIIYYDNEPVNIVNIDDIYNMDDMDVESLKVIYEKSHNSLIAPLFLIEKFCVSDEEIGDRLEIMDEDGYVKVAKGAYSSGMSLLNGINYVGIAAKGRQILRDKKLI